MTQTSLFAVEKRLSIEDKIKLQERALRNVAYVPFDRQNIAEAMPLLLEHQVDNCHKASCALWRDNKKAMLFTDATGTGKTMTALSIIKTAERRGIKDILIVVPTDAMAKVWIMEARYFGIYIIQLADTKDACREGTVIVTTFANMRQNERLLDRAHRRQFGLVVYDESHNLTENGSGNETATDRAHKQITFSPSYSRAFGQDEWKDLYDATKVIFLSATPFAYHKSLIYADGYLFNIMESETDPKARAKAYNDFFVKNFGYRERDGKLMLPDASVNVGELERAFHTKMTEAGVISSTRLKLDTDYSREFILVDNMLGLTIDEGYRIASDTNVYKYLPEVIKKKFSYLFVNQILECIKAQLYIDRIKEHLALGRKVVIFHSYNNSLPSHPFDLDDPILRPAGVPKRLVDDEIEQFHRKYPQYQELDLNDLANPIATMKKHFPTAVYFNGTVKTSDRNTVKSLFNKDTSGIDIIVVQIEAGKEGISLHDITGKMQRVGISLCLPTRPTDAIQFEGRINRIGQKTNAVVEYPVTHLNFEKRAFAEKINERVKTVENLAFGNQARNLKDAFKEGYKAPVQESPSLNQGFGGRDRDFVFDTMDPWSMAIKIYTDRGSLGDKARLKEGAGYTATPEPLGMKMVEWLCTRGNDKLLEPSAGHGAIARYFPENTENRFIEPNYNLKSDLAINTTGFIISGKFEDLHQVNKYDGIAMYAGMDERMAWDHISRAVSTHLKDTGRLICIVPHTPTTKQRLDLLLYNNRTVNATARISLPEVAFERAGNVKTVLFVLDKQDFQGNRLKIGDPLVADLSKETTIDGFFAAIKDLSVPKKVRLVSELRPLQPPPTLLTTKPRSEVISGMHTKFLYQIWTVKINRNLSQAEFSRATEVATSLGGRFSKYDRDKAIPGFIFRNAARANELKTFINAL